MPIFIPRKIEYTRSTPAANKEREEELENILAKIESNNLAKDLAQRELLKKLNYPPQEIEAIMACFCRCHPKAGDGSIHFQEKCRCEMSSEEIGLQREINYAKFSNIISRSEGEIAKEKKRKEEIEIFAEKTGLDLKYIGGAIPFVIRGVYRGRAFYLREREEEYRIEISSLENPMEDPYLASEDQGSLVCAEGLIGELYQGKYSEFTILRTVISMLEDIFILEGCTHQGRESLDRFCRKCGYKF